MLPQEFWTESKVSWGRKGGDYMKRTGIIVILLLLLLDLSGCNKVLGGAILEKHGMKFTSQIEMLEKALSIDLDDLTDKHIKTIYSHTDESGNDLTIQYIDLDGSGEVVEEDIANNENWCKLPFNSTMQELLQTNKANEQYDFEGIEEGYYILSGVDFSQEGYDFNIDNYDNWYAFQIGIWDSNDETLYYISITDQFKS